MNIVLTGSLGNIGRPLTTTLVNNGHTVTVISSHPERKQEIEHIGAKAAIGKLQEVDFLTTTFQGADIVYLMETMEAVGDMFDKSIDFIRDITQIGLNYKEAIMRSGVKKVIHLSSIGAHTNKGTGIIRFHYEVETILRQLPPDIAVKFIRPVSFYINLYTFIPTIKTAAAIISNYGGDVKEPWVSPKDIAAAIAEEIDLPFNGTTVRYVASDEVSPNEIARTLGEAIGQPDLEWRVISSQQLLDNWLRIGFNEQVAKGFVELQESQATGLLYKDYNLHKPVLGNVKLKDFAKDFADAYRMQ
ncbi:uncharacterized protein YbjT (DUF2867 family) [Chitinophaga dinghuensis]|uniref:Uncharacterized protein YbjT (DUF2867 family) n=1 Tax=Chitinophaga dinghuensis TaxID=1539050 RepID=A0A327VZP5_9BACT|nr:NAD(P)H-binding protein [Chitinophaga dinghuensis]RAJ77262.1 uncharacterized protein YbjT (DUF2867 family) [Chitinophaga dinghuensis]